LFLDASINIIDDTDYYVEVKYWSDRVEHAVQVRHDTQVVIRGRQVRITELFEQAKSLRGHQIEFVRDGERLIKCEVH
jgi:hypothetical protein